MAAAHVLHNVHVDFLLPLVFASFDGGEVREISNHLSGNAQRPLARPVVAAGVFPRRQYVQAAFARRLHKGGDVPLLEDRVQVFGDHHDLGEGRLAGVEVKYDEIRPVKVLDTALALRLGGKCQSRLEKIILCPQTFT